MKIKVFPLGDIQTNCYIVIEELTKKAIVIDPGNDGYIILEYLLKEGLNLQGIFLTHGHFDHIGGIEEIIAKYEVPVYISYNDAKFLQDAQLNLSRFVGNPISLNIKPVYIKDGDELYCGNICFKVIETPGHTPGGVCYYTAGNLFAGDTLFKQSVGRTDFPGGNYSQIVNSVREKLYILPDETIVYPGHGPSTTIGQEKVENMAVRLY